MYRVKANADDPRGGSYVEYRRAKQRKMAAQLSETELTDLFRGKVFWLNGRLDPPTPFLRKLIGIHGGRVVFQWNSTVNIMVAYRLSSVSYMKYKDKMAIVTPDFVLRCTEENQLFDTKAFEYSADRNGENAQNHGFQSIFPPFEVTRGDIFPWPPEIDDSTEIYSLSQQISYYIDMDAVNRSMPYKMSYPKASDAFNAQVTYLRISPEKRGAEQQNEFNLAQYHAQSRLHHLSKWKLDAQEFLIENPPYGPTPAANQRYFYCYADIDCFFVQALTSQHKDRYEGVPVAVCSCYGGDDSTADVSSCNYVARASGVRNGQFLRDARTLCPDLQVLYYDFELYYQLSRNFYDCMRDYTTQIQPVSCDEAVLCLSGIIDDESCYKFMSALKERFKRVLNLTVTLGVGNSILGARMAVRLAKPDGAMFLRNAELLEHLADRDVTVIPYIGPESARILYSNQIRNCRECHSQTLYALQQLIGPTRGRQLFNALRGNDIIYNFRPICAGQIPKEISVSANYGVRARTVLELRSVFDQISHELQVRAERRELDICGFGCKVSLSLYQKQNQSGNADQNAESASKYTKPRGMGLCKFVSYDVVPMANETRLSALNRLFQKMMLKTNLSDFRGMAISAKVRKAGAAAEVEESVTKNETPNSRGAVHFEASPPRYLRFREVIDVSGVEVDALSHKIAEFTAELRPAMAHLFGLQFCRRGDYGSSVQLAMLFPSDSLTSELYKRWFFLSIEFN